MLTQNEKEILGAMVDRGQLRGEERIAVGADDMLARERIAEFKAQQTSLLQRQIDSLTKNKESIEAEIIKLTNLQTLLEQ